MGDAPQAIAKMSTTVIDIQGKKAKWICTDMPTDINSSNNNASLNSEYVGSGFVATESPSTKVSNATIDDQHDKMDVEMLQLTCVNTIDVESEAFKVTVNLKAINFNLEMGQKASVVSSLVFQIFGSFFSFLKREFKKQCKDCEIYKRYRERIVKSIAKLILGVYDLDDLIRIHYEFELERQTKLLACKLVQLKSTDNVNAIISAIASKKIDLSNYPLQREQDVGYVLFLMEKSDIEVVKTEVENFKDFEGKKKRNILEELEQKQKGMLDVLFSEAVREMKIFEMENFLQYYKRKKFDSPNWCAATDLTDLVDSSLFLFTVSRIKMMEEIRYWVTLPLTSGWMGKFSEEVVEVISGADLLRRLDAHSYISAHHVLQALGEKPVVVAVQKLVSDALLTCSIEPAKFPPYNIYKYSLELANKHGAAEVRVEHLAVAAACKGACLGQDLCHNVWTEENALNFLNLVDANSEILPVSGFSERIQEACDGVTMGFYDIFEDSSLFRERLLECEQKKWVRSCEDNGSL
ncbi:Glycoside hydrolase, family 5 [Quillaja saponaria]|uniref:Glycoside hydrolase, family 5 n=1 Tax=Quillaja saponaria TaxID=32244 RepID=A0AAD7LMC6_QUISA|nr:Glycoside hydrolase, family 5 [Quillaja saponaria]